MSSLLIRGPCPPLVGHVALRGGKNAALPVLIAAVASNATVHFQGLPTGLLDVRAALALLRSVGAVHDDAHAGVGIGGAAERDAFGPAIRSTPLLLTALLGRHRVASVPLPGGCAIGPRLIQAHLAVLAGLGASVRIERGRLVAEAPAGLRGAPLTLESPSTTATQVALLGAALATGRSVIRGGNLRFENRFFIESLQALGARIHLQDDDAILVDGGGFSGGTVAIPATGDEAATWLAAGIVTGGRVSVGPVAPAAFSAERLAFLAAGCEVLAGADDRLSLGTCDLRPFRIRTGPPPALGSDLQPILGAIAATMPGPCTLEDPRFPERFTYLSGFASMGIRCDREGHRATIRGGPRRGADLEAPDLRGGMALVLAALGAHGETRITHFERVQRGYEDIDLRLRALGADVSFIA